MSKLRICIDAPKITRDEALEFMVHHLQLAAMYFEAIPDTDKLLQEREIKRLIGSDDRTQGPAIAFYRRIWEYYEEMKDRD